MNRDFWTGIFAQLSEFFKEPTEEFADDVASGRLLSFFDDVFMRLGLDASVLAGLSPQGNVEEILKYEYRKLFTGPVPPYIVPAESIYKRWSSDPECNLPISREKGYLMGDPAIDMIKRYQAEGILIPDEYSSMPDHIALELEYMSFLCRSGCVERQKEFLLQHLDWVDELSEEIKSLDRGIGFYSMASEITGLIIQYAAGKGINTKYEARNTKHETHA